VTRTRRTAAGAVVLVASAVLVAVVGWSRAHTVTSAATEPAPTTVEVELGTLATTVSLRGTLTRRARSDGSPYVAVNQARGTYTALPDRGTTIGCGGELYRVDDRPVLLLCGPIPAYRGLHLGDAGNDVRQLNANLHELGVDAAAGVDLDPGDDSFTDLTAKALEQLQRDRGADPTGELHLDGAIVLPEPVRVAAVTGKLGAPAQPGEPLLDATSDALEVQVALEGSQQRSVAVGDRVQITLPSNASVAGEVDRLGTIAPAPTGPDGGDGAGPATIPAFVRLDDPAATGGLDEAPVQVEITTEGVDDALSVPLTAIVGKAGGGYAVEVVRDDGRRQLAAVELGLVDASAGRVQVRGEVAEGDRVVVPSS